MKKTGVLSLVLLLLACCLGALAEQAAAPATIPFAYNVIPVEGLPYRYGIPKEWVQEQLTEDALAWGQIGKFQHPLGTASVLVTLEELDLKDYPEGLTIDQLAELMKKWKGYRDVERTDIGQTSFISYAQQKEKTTGLMTMLPGREGEQLILRFDFAFHPADESTAELSRQIAGLLAELAQ